MPKMKTHSGAKKRIRVTGTGKLTHKSGGRRAKMEKKSGRVIRRLKPAADVTSPDRKKLKRMLAR